MATVKLKDQDLKLIINNLSELHSLLSKIIFLNDVFKFNEKYKRSFKYKSNFYDLNKLCKEYMEYIKNIGIIISKIGEFDNLIIINDRGEEINKLDFYFLYADEIFGYTEELIYKEIEKKEIEIIDITEFIKKIYISNEIKINDYKNIYLYIYQVNNYIEKIIKSFIKIIQETENDDFIEIVNVSLKLSNKLKKFFYYPWREYHNSDKNEDLYNQNTDYGNDGYIIQDGDDFVGFRG